MYYRVARSSCKDSLKVLEEDIERANALAAAIPRAKHGSYLQMKLVYNQLAPLLLFLMQWVDCSCTCVLPRYLNFFHILVYKVYTDGRPNISAHGRKATVKDFYAIILPSLQRLQASAEELDNAKAKHVKSDNSSERRVEGDGKHWNGDLEREDECGICLEQPSTKMVLPNCCHSMCIKCYHNWNTRSESCPFCRGSLKRIKSEDLWVLTGNEDVPRFYLYITTLPKEYPDALFLVYHEFLI
ncbi:uncharacterized protein LOC111491874 [Cucurbita maxima]|uniref:Uncharacterized protein LOC111491874 n=1 Tax=Cucurbita maxima TaxID=3661 RepID=A0A6J1KBT4_CUCMA|nr:uncharacterized protein LOC111491874 [Cucurbita maxima]XP_022996710.1 uncharacterized protein LOC111491874 [Cucurbita maxima]